jgi:hypothetical protein
MISGEIHHLRYSLILAFLSSIAAGCAVYLKQDQWAFAALGLSMACCIYAYLSHIAFIGEIHSSLQALGSFMRGMLDVRLEVRLKSRVWAYFQHRCNNLLDLIDYYIRDHEAGFETDEGAVYLRKLKETGLYAVLKSKQEAAMVRQAEQAIILPAPKTDQTDMIEKLIAQKAVQAEMINAYEKAEHDWLVRVEALQAKHQQMQKALEYIAAFYHDATAENKGDVPEDNAAGCDDSIAMQNQQMDGFLAQMEASTQMLQNMLQDNAYLMLRLGEHMEEFGLSARLTHGITGQTYMLALSTSMQAIRGETSGKNLGELADEVKVLANQAGQASALIQENTAILQQSVGNVATSAQYLQTMLADDLDMGALSNHIAQLRELLAANAQQPKPATLPEETLEILLELSQSISRDIHHLKAEFHESITQEKPHAA